MASFQDHITISGLVGHPIKAKHMLGQFHNTGGGLISWVDLYSGLIYIVVASFEGGGRLHGVTLSVAVLWFSMGCDVGMLLLWFPGRG